MIKSLFHPLSHPVTEYNKLPVMYKLDDYDKCLTAVPKKVSVYCLVKTEINPSSNPERWKLIEKYSQNKNLHFDHDVIERGICITWCQRLIANLDNFTRESLSVDKINANSKVSFQVFVLRFPFIHVSSRFSTHSPRMLSTIPGNIKRFTMS